MVIYVKPSSEDIKSPLLTENMPSRSSNIFRKILATVEILLRLALMIVSRFWKMCTTGLLIVTLLFWTEGGTYAFCFFVLGVFGLLYHAQDMLLYHPESPPDSRLMVITPEAFQMPYENHFIRTKDGTRINVVLIKQMQRSTLTVIFFHGNAGNIGHRLQNALGLYSILNANILMVEYRGYGKSEGGPSESGLYQDAEAAMDFLLKRSDIDQTQIVLFGRSLGGAVAIYLASSPFYGPKIAAVVLENTFTSLYDMSHKILRFSCIKYIPRLCYKNKFPSLQRIELVSTPALFLSGTMDELVPPKMMKELYNKCNSNFKRLELFANGTHNDTWMCPGYYEAWMRFIPEALRHQPVMSSNQNSGYTLGSVISL
ncbi:alpha/beta hydrolase domain-containing protein 13 [Biomphalaria glabrata]|uniref:Protein ABHD13 n=1 Tax=Biomphalaria glabrata TaxID=6526 RepID=A0A2C9JZK4_BIOGL|nr:alpha/beta hydrolase domain-containing protein 13 [Biomphalaria glabrata]